MNADPDQQDSNAIQGLHALISGRVHGVSFRYYTRRKALELGLVGWVRNLVDGRVECVAVGHPDALEELVGFLKVGPPSAIVSDVELSTGVQVEEFETFSIRHDGIS